MQALVKGMGIVWVRTKKDKVLVGIYYFCTICSMLVGIWHFFVPWLYSWKNYIPSEYSNLVVLIDWINLLFSLFLSGLSLLLIIWRKKIMSGNREAITVFGFMTFVWIFRVAIALIEPYPASVLAWAAYGQLLGCAMIMVLFLITFIWIIKKAKSLN